MPTPTQQQQDIIDAFTHNNNIVVQAGAGTGKTTTINMLVEQLPHMNKRGIYLAFNKAIVNDVTHSIPPTARNHIDIRTFHSLCYRICTNTPELAHLTHDSHTNDIEFKKLVELVGLTLNTRLHFTINNNKIEWKIGRIISAINATIKNYCHSDATHIDTNHVLIPTGVTDPHEKATATTLIRDAAQQYWDNYIMDPNLPARLNHDWYLKAASLADYDFTTLGIDVIFFDEAQDANPAMTHMVLRQLDLNPHMRVVAVGDSSQAINASFTGSIDALPTFAMADNAIELPLTQSWRFGKNIANYANGVLKDSRAYLTLEGMAPHESTVGFYDGGLEGLVESFTHNPGDAILVRTNSTNFDISGLLVDAGFRVYSNADKNQIFNIAHDMTLIEEGNITARRKIPELAYIFSDADLDDFMEQVPLTPEISPLQQTITKIERNGIGYYLELFDRLETSESTADVVVSTMHKSKGRQWDTVYLHSDLMNGLPGLFLSMFFHVNPDVLPESVEEAVAHFYEKFSNMKEEHRAEGGPLTSLEEYAFGLLDNEYDPAAELTALDIESYNLLYVSLTRAKRHLYVPRFIDDSLTFRRQYESVREAQ